MPQLNIIELAAVLASAISGMIEARNNKMDIIGVYFVAMVTALGGGTIRDLLIHKHPIFWAQNQIYPLSIFLLSLLSLKLITKETWNYRTIRWIIVILDALALGMFSIVGADYAIHKQCSFFVCIIMGVITGTFGGVIRDILCNKIPSVFGPSHELYASCAFSGSLLFCMLHTTGFNHYLSSIISILFIILFRLTAKVMNWRLPSFLTSR